MSVPANHLTPQKEKDYRDRIKNKENAFDRQCVEELFSKIDQLDFFLTSYHNEFRDRRKHEKLLRHRIKTLKEHITAFLHKFGDKLSVDLEILKNGLKIDRDLAKKGRRKRGG